MAERVRAAYCRLFDIPESDFIFDTGWIACKWVEGRDASDDEEGDHDWGAQVT